MSTPPTEPAEPGQKSATLSGQQTPLRPKAVPDVDPDEPPEEFADAIEADDFVIIGKASIEKLDTGGENSDTREILDLSSDAVERALDRFFNSEKAPGIISIGHDDIPVGRPLQEYTFEEERSIQIGDETYEFDAGDTATTHVEDADGDGRPELWMIGDLANDTDIARKARLGVLTEELDGFSVTFGRKDVEQEGAGQRVTDYDLFSVTMAPSDMIANKGSEFDLAAFKAELDLDSYQPGARGDDAISPSGGRAEQMAAVLSDTMSDSTTPDDTNGLLRRMGDALRQKAEEDEQTDGEASDEGQKADDEGQKQPPEGDDDGNTVEDLVRALADELDEDPQVLMEALGQAADDPPDEDEEEDDEEEDEDEEEAMKSDEDGGDSTEVTIDFGAKLEEHGVVTEDDLGEKLDGIREEIVDDIGEKLAETNKEAVEEIAQKMETGGTPHPAGGSFQDEQDFESHLDEIADGEEW